MGSEEYIELPPLDNEGGNDQGEDSMLQEVNKEDFKRGGGDEKSDLHEDGNKDNLKREDTNKDADKDSNDLLKDGNQNEGIKVHQGLNFHLNSPTSFAVDESGLVGDKDNHDLLKDDNKMEQGLNFHLNSPTMLAVDEEYKVAEMKSGLVEENGSAFVEENERIKIDITSRSGVKRPRPSYNDDQPFVQVIYNYLPRESKKKLGELLQNWSEWHSQYVGNAKKPIEESLECGDEIYFPALQVGGENTSMMMYWMDKPAKHNIKEGTKDHLAQENEEGVPYYDRACAAPLSIQDGSTKFECSDELPAEASRCFNCGSYSHSLKDCSKPRDNTAINNARNQHKSKRAQASGPRCPQRYYQNSPGGKFEGIKPGMLGTETRQSLGIGELDPPPWLHRMRELGYPPGYLDSEDPDEPSGIVIYADDEDMELEEEGEFLEGEHSNSSAKKRMTVPFPGINAPIPENADERLWGGSILGRDDSSTNRKADAGHTYSSPSSLSIMVRESRFDQARPSDYNSLPDEPPGTERVGNNVFSSDYTLRGRGGNNTSSPHYSSESQQSKMRYPNLSRSVSDSGRRTPNNQDNSPRGIHVQGTSPRYGEHGWSPYGQYSPRSPHQYSSPSPGGYSPQIYNSVSRDFAHPDRRHGRGDKYAVHDAKQKKERPEGSRYHRR